MLLRLDLVGKLAAGTAGAAVAWAARGGRASAASSLGEISQPAGPEIGGRRLAQNGTPTGDVIDANPSATVSALLLDRRLR